MCYKIHNEKGCLGSKSMTNENMNESKETYIENTTLNIYIYIYLYF